MPQRDAAWLARLVDKTGYTPTAWERARLVPVMGNAAGTSMPDEVLAVLSPLELAGLGLAGIVLAVLGSLVPAGWAARTRAANALRAE